MQTSFEGADSIGLLDLSLQNKHYSTLKCKHFLAVLLSFAKIFREICVESYKAFNEVNFSSMRVKEECASEL